MKKSMMPIVALAALAGCGDDPENVPLKGEWKTVTRVDSLSIDGMSLGRSDFPPEFLALEGEEEKCFEPMLAHRDWQEATLNRNVRGTCTIDTFDATPTSIEMKGRCEGVEPRMNFNPAVEGRVRQAEDSYRLVMTIRGSAELPEVPGTHVIQAIAVQEGTRLGDC